MSMSSIHLSRREAALTGRVIDFLELTKPRISILVLVSVAVAAFTASWGQPDPWLLLHAVVGTFLVSASGSAWNQWLERDLDSRMERTANRPLPAGRITPTEAAVFGSVTLLLGIIYLYATTGGTPAGLALVTWVLYTGCYTPLKVRSWCNTAVGAVAGAMPVLIGWTAVGGTLDVRAAALFAVVFLWQFPHFMAIAWLYRNQYAEAGYQMLTVVDPSGRRAGVQAVLGALALLPASFVPALHVPSPTIYIVTALILGIYQLLCALMFLGRIDDRSAKRLLRVSLIYLPSLLLLMVLIPGF